MKQSGIATGVLVAAIGVWLVMRTITHDDQGNNLVDRLFGLDNAATSSTTATSAPAPTAAAVANDLAPHLSPKQLHNARRRGVVSGRGMG